MHHRLPGESSEFRLTSHLQPQLLGMLVMFILAYGFRGFGPWLLNPGAMSMW